MIFNIIHRVVRHKFMKYGAKSSFIKMDNCLVHYLDSGENDRQETVFLIHGLGTSTSTWVHTFPHLAKSYRTIAIDLPGFGLSEIHNGKSVMTIDDYTEILAAFIRKLLPEQFTIVGHSLGGWLAMRCAKQFPKRVRHLVLVNTAGIYYAGMEKHRELFEIRNHGDVRQLIDLLWLKHPWYLRPSIGSIYRELRKRKVPEFVQTVTMDDFFNADLLHLRLPVRILWGRQDRLTSTETIDIVRKAIDDVKVEFIDGCGHVPQLEKPRAFNSALLKMLNEREH